MPVSRACACAGGRSAAATARAPGKQDSSLVIALEGVGCPRTSLLRVRAREVADTPERGGQLAPGPASWFRRCSINRYRRFMRWSKRSISVQSKPRSRKNAVSTSARTWKAVAEPRNVGEPRILMPLRRRFNMRPLSGAWARRSSRPAQGM